MKLTSITPQRLINATRLLLAAVSATLLFDKKVNIWIISERNNQARDNGYCFFKYMRERHPEQQVFYIIDCASNDYNKIVRYGNIIQYDSWKHYLYFCMSKVHISAHVGGCVPSNNPFVKRIKRILGYKDVFIPHGVSYGISEFCLEKYAKLDLFVTSGKPEYDNVLKNYGYNQNQVVYTGFPRQDEWYDLKIIPNQIVLMPTWRLYLAQKEDTVIKNTLFFRKYYDLINSPDLSEFLINNDLKLIFYLHHEMRKYVDEFHTKCENIVIVYRDEDYDIQQLLKESALLITDYSSVHFDFAYMGKPVLYYQFDKKEFWSKQYQKSDFDAGKNGFGRVAYEQEELIDDIKTLHAIGFKQEELFKQRMEQFYLLRDQHNCERVYEEIKRRWS